MRVLSKHKSGDCHNEKDVSVSMGTSNSHLFRIMSYCLNGNRELLSCADILLSCDVVSFRVVAAFE